MPSIENTAAKKQNPPTIKHGILSNTKLFPWESKEAYSKLHQGLIDDYFPEGENQRLLVEELTDIAWRKRRLNDARKSNAAKKMYILIDNHSFDEGTSADYALTFTDAPYMTDMRSKTKEMVKISEQEVKEELPELAEEYKALKKIVADIDSDAGMDYKNMLDTLPDDIQEQWLQLVEYDSEPERNDLLNFLHHNVLSELEERQTLLNNHQAIKQQTFGEIYHFEANEERLIRYEQFLDRKFEKTLAMLIKLKELRPWLNKLQQKQPEQASTPVN